MITIEFKLYSDGSRAWYLDGRYHRDNDLPAVIYPNGTKNWYQKGKRHRDNNQPATIRNDGSKMWYQNDKLLIQAKSLDCVKESK